MRNYHFPTSFALRLLTNYYRYDFEYEDADEDEAGDVGIENKYYNAKQIKADNPEEAINEFSEVPALEEEKGDWCASIISASKLEEGFADN